MLEYLASIFSKITELFGSFWYIITWLLKTAYNYLYNYVTDLHPSVQDYKWYRAATLIYYQYTAKDKTDDIAVTNYTTTRYSAIDSFLDLFNYRTYLKGTLEWIKSSAVSPIQTILINGFTMLYYLILTPKTTFSYLFSKAISLLTDYDTYDRKSVKAISPRSNRLVKITDDEPYSILNTLTGGLYNKIKDSVTRLFPATNHLFDNLGRFSNLVGNLMFGRLGGLTGENYNKFEGLAERYNKIASLVEQGKLKRINYFTEDRFKDLFDLLEKPHETILDKLKGKFFSWFLTELWDYITSED